MKQLLVEFTCILQVILLSKNYLEHFACILRVIPTSSSTKKVSHRINFFESLILHVKVS